MHVHSRPKSLNVEVFCWCSFPHLAYWNVLIDDHQSHILSPKLKMLDIPSAWITDWFCGYGLTCKPGHLFSIATWVRYKLLWLWSIAPCWAICYSSQTALIFDICIISRLLVIVDREMDELMKKAFWDEVIKKILKDRRTYSVREKEKVWYQNGNKMCVCVQP